MHITLPTLLTLSLAHLVLTQPRQIVACIDFTGYVSITPFSSPQNYTVTASLRSGTNVSTLAEVCSLNTTYQNSFIGFGLKCVTGYTSMFIWGEGEVSFTTPTVPSFIGADPAFIVNKTASADGNGTVYNGRFGCDGKNDTVTAEWNWGGF